LSSGGKCTKMKSNTKELLKQSGWFEGRSVYDVAQEWIQLWETKGIFYPDFVKEILYEYGELRLEEETGWYYGLYFNPIREAIHEDYLFTRHKDITVSNLYPIAEERDATYYLCLSEDGIVYTSGDMLVYNAPNFQAYLDANAATDKQLLHQRVYHYRDSK
jgi:SUKH-3 immunity protein